MVNNVAGFLALAFTRHIGLKSEQRHSRGFRVPFRGIRGSRLYRFEEKLFQLGLRTDAADLWMNHFLIRFSQLGK